MAAFSFWEAGITGPWLSDEWSEKTSKGIGFPDPCYGCWLLMSTTSESVCPRSSANCFPSIDQWKS